MDNLESNISISDSTADGLRSDPYLRDAIALPKFEPESLDEYNARRLAQCKEKLRALLFGMFTDPQKLPRQQEGRKTHREPLPKTRRAQNSS